MFPILLIILWSSELSCSPLQAGNPCPIGSTVGLTHAIWDLICCFTSLTCHITGTLQSLSWQFSFITIYNNLWFDESSPVFSESSESECLYSGCKVWQLACSTACHSWRSLHTAGGGQIIYHHWYLQSLHVEPSPHTLLQHRLDALCRAKISVHYNISIQQYAEQSP